MKAEREITENPELGVTLIDRDEDALRVLADVYRQVGLDRPLALKAAAADLVSLLD